MSSRYVWTKKTATVQVGDQAPNQQGVRRPTNSDAYIYTGSLAQLGNVGNMPSLCAPNAHGSKTKVKHNSMFTPSAGSYFQLVSPEGEVFLPLNGSVYKAIGNGARVVYNRLGDGDWEIRYLDAYICEEWEFGSDVTNISNASQGTYPPRDNRVLSYIYWPLRSPRSSPR